jgi:hypothetical protein
MRPKPELVLTNMPPNSTVASRKNERLIHKVKDSAKTVLFALVVLVPQHLAEFFYAKLWNLNHICLYIINSSTRTS